MTSVFNNLAKSQNVQRPLAMPVQNLTVKDALPASKMNEPVDTVSLSTQTSKKEKKGFFKSINSGIAKMSKFFAAVGEYTKGTFKGLFNGALAGSLVYTAGTIFNSIKTRRAPEGQTVKLFHNKIAAGVVAAATFGINIWKSSLNLNMKNSQIDHKWTGHQ